MKMLLTKKWLRTSIGVGLTLSMAVAGGPASTAASSEVKAVYGKPVVRRLSPSQYRNIITEVFGPAIELGGRFEPDTRINGLTEIGASQVSVSSAGMAQFDIMARSIASQVTSERNRKIMIPCAPQNAAVADSKCAQQFFGEVGRLLFRRPLSTSEQSKYVEAANVTAASTNDFYTGLSLSLAAMLSSPQFLFRQADAVPDGRNYYRLDDYSKASRLSFFLWNTMPDEVLLKAAEKGELRTQRGLKKQVDRMIASPKLVNGARAFFSDMLHLDEVPEVVKDATLFPKFDSIVAADAKEQTLRTISKVLIEDRSDYRSIFTTKKTFLTQALAAMYRVPLANDVPNGSPDSWQPYEFSSEDPRGGILTHLSFLSLHSHAGRTSPTLRGKAVREILLCQKVPAPPGDVQINLVQDTNNPAYRTARDRLNAHATNPVCAGCHKITDPMGLALENFDGAGGYRARENGVAPDTKGTLDGANFDGPAELGRVLSSNRAATSCLVDRLVAYGAGRSPVSGEVAWVANLKKDFESDGYVIPEMMKEIALSAEFYRTAPTEPSDLEASMKQNSPQPIRSQE